MKLKKKTKLITFTLYSRTFYTDQIDAQTVSTHVPMSVPKSASELKLIDREMNDQESKLNLY